MVMHGTARTGVGAILYAGRELSDAVEEGSPEEIRSCAAALLDAARKREGDPATAGFRSAVPGDAVPGDAVPGDGALPGGPVEPDQAALHAALAELDVAAVLLAGAAVTENPAGEPARDRGGEPARDRGGEPARDPAGAAGGIRAVDRLEGLSEALDRLQVDSRPAGAAVSTGLFGRTGAVPPFAEQLPATVDGIVDRTAAVARSVLTGLTTIPAGDAKKIMDGALAAVPAVGPLAAAGLRSLRRAWEMLSGLVPKQLIEAATEWARGWWENGADQVFAGAARRALSVDSLTALIDSVNGNPGIDPLRLDGAAARLADLDGRHTGSLAVVERVVTALSRLTGPLALLVTAAAGWIYAAGGSGLLLALGAAIWIGRDHLDTGSVVDRVAGVRAILIDVTA